MKIVSLLLICFVFVYCKRNSDAIILTENNIGYRILDLAIDESKIKTGDYVELNYAIIQSDQAYFSTLKKGSFIYNVYNDSCKSNFQEVFLQLSNGDSAVIFFDALTFFNCVLKSDIPPFLDTEKEVEVYFRINKVTSEMAALKSQKELIPIDTFAEQFALKVNEIKLIADTVIKYDNLIIGISGACNDHKIHKGNKVKIVHETLLFDGRIIEGSTHEEPFEVVVGQQGQVIDGIALALGYMCEGQSAIILIPNNLSFSKSFRQQMGIFDQPIICHLEVLMP